MIDLKKWREMTNRCTGEELVPSCLDEYKKDKCRFDEARNYLITHAEEIADELELYREAERRLKVIMAMLEEGGE